MGEAAGGEGGALMAQGTREASRVCNVGGPQGYPLPPLGTKPARKTLTGGVGRAGGLYTDMHTEAHQGGYGGERRQHWNFGGTGCRARAPGRRQDAPLKTLGHTAGLLKLMG